MPIIPCKTANTGLIDKHDFEQLRSSTTNLLQKAADFVGDNLLAVKRCWTSLIADWIAQAQSPSSTELITVECVVPFCSTGPTVLQITARPGADFQIPNFINQRDLTKFSRVLIASNWSTTGLKSVCICLLTNLPSLQLESNLALYKLVSSNESSQIYCFIAINGMYW